MDRPPRQTSTPPPVSLLYFAEGCASIGGNLMQVGIFFYTNRRYGWGLRENFTLAAVQGVVYVVGALAANGIAARIAPRRVLTALHAILAVVALSTVFTNSPKMMTATVLLYTALMAIGWPIFESLVSVGVDAKTMARRLAAYNLVWSGTGAATIAVNGTIIAHWPAGVFIITAIVHGMSSLFVCVNRSIDAPKSTASHVDPEPELLRVRTVALWLSRISMPASYALVYSLSALLPSLPAIQHLGTAAATLVGSMWLMSRWVTFLLLGMTDWWHTRPRTLLAAAWLMLASFAGIAWQPSSGLSVHNALFVDLAWLVGCQIVIGIAIGMIYYASLYIGMVLSDGSTEHGGYHEALIGLGTILGPGAGAVAQVIRPGETITGIFAVVGVLTISTLLATGASAVAARRNGA